jgi:ABC-type Mn2+/Zn2+ transport system ATPase subunit
VEVRGRRRQGEGLHPGEIGAEDGEKALAAIDNLGAQGAQGVIIIYEVLYGLAEQGIAIIVISSELPEVMGISDRILVMCGAVAQVAQEDSQ